MLNAKLNDFMEKLNKAKGSGTLVPISQHPNIQRISSGITHLDLSLGGGWPIGRLSLIWGLKSSCKTTVCLKAVVEAQKLCRHDGLLLGSKEDSGYSKLPIEPIFYDAKGKEASKEEALNKKGELNDGFSISKFQEPMRVLIVNQEGALEIEWAKKLGVNVDLDLVVLNTISAEETIDIVDTMMRERLVDFVIIDSLAAMTPSKEIEDTTENWQQGLQARLINKALRIWISTINSFKSDELKPTMLLVNQLRQKIGVMYGNPDVKPGGIGQDFATSIEVKLSEGSANKDTDFAEERDGGHKLVTRINYKITKNKTFPSNGSGQFLLAVAPFQDYNQGQIIEDKQLLGLAEDYGLLYKEKTSFFFLGEEYKTKKSILDKLSSDVEFYESFRRYLKDFIIRYRLKKS